ncbi:MAG: DUF503 domain-containing protein [Pseudomonadales bacterium]
MNVRLLIVDFRLGGCRSLKEKRQRLKGLRERFGKATNVAVCESAFQDALQRAQWSFVATSANGDVAERALSEILQSIQLSVDAELIGVQQESLLP